MRHILKGDENRNIWLDGTPLSLQKSLEYYNHSPTGFNWGYGGSGPAQLALAIILELTGKPDGYQQFKWDVIANILRGAFEIEFEYPYVEVE